MSDNVRKVCGHPKRQWPKCECPWHFHFKWQGKHHRYSLDKLLGRHVDSKSIAVEEAATIRKQIKAGTFGQAAPIESMTLRQLADVYIERYVDVERAATKPEFVYSLNTICRTELPRPTGGTAKLANWRVTDVITDTIERFREIRRAAGAGLVGVNRNVRTLRALFNWAIRTGYVKETPFKRGSETVIKLAKEPKRSRRLREGEEEKLLAAAGPHLRAVIECALETGMRRGEIMSLQWKQVEGIKIEGDSTITWAPRSEIFLPAAKTKTKTGRRIPVSPRLRGILDMRRFDPDGRPLALDAYVFGNEIGHKIDAPKRAWLTCVLKAHGHNPSYTKQTKNLTAESRAALAAIDLHFHDLRREAGSRWLEGGVPLHTVRDWLGHTSIAQTSTYLAGTIATQHDAMRRFEEHRAALQLLATGSETGGRNRDQSAGARPQKTRKTGVSHDLVTV